MLRARPTEYRTDVLNGKIGNWQRARTFRAAWTRYPDRVPFPTSEDLVAAAEAGLGRRLSDLHRRRLIRSNGGEITAGGQEWSLFPVWDASDRRTMGRTANHIIRENEALRREWPDALPQGYIAIADDVGANMLVVGPSGDTVFDWDSATGILAAVEVDWST